MSMSYKSVKLSICLACESAWSIVVVVATTAFSQPTPAYAQAMALKPSGPTKATPADAFARAQALVRSGSRLDMGSLASELGIARATLYRWTGDRDRLLSDILWADAQRILDHVAADTPGVGVTRIHDVAIRFLELLLAGEELTSFLRNERDHGLRLITDPQGGVRPRLVEAIATHIAGEVTRGAYRPPDDPTVLADGIVTLGERFLYHGGATEANPDPTTAFRVIALLLREEPVADGAPRTAFASPQLPAN
jgi:AcrR family transcriptional regulator